MNLIIEQGNTSTKVGIYNKGQLEVSLTYNVFDLSVVTSLLETYSPTNGILSTVTGISDDVILFLKEKLPAFILLNEHVSLPITIGYETPETLGKDRLAAAVGANYLQPGKDILVIDAGTAITYEVIEASGLYLGGNISPGMTTRFRALHEFTKKLPLVNEKEEVPLIGVNTRSAIQAGVVHGIIFEMDGYIDKLKAKYPDLLVFLTGGHSFYFERRLKNCIFADINLVLMGLNRILEYNVEN
ncbi:type III pantothenate kinase [Parabacteroides sp. PF5-9]|uniref:type III pantothenate kinase n=1 Tax=Parabacteroides sp. PF5-9 TaxID=1742404 RepID=UPI002473426E|nr:type III pantothenate kinase [Parabacteroides sp. PF5-9]